MKERKAELQKLIDFKKLKGASRKPRYATRKLTIGLVSCMLGFTLLVSPQSVEASEATQTQATTDVDGAGSGNTDETSADNKGEKEDATTAGKQAKGSETPAGAKQDEAEKHEDGQTGQAEGKQELQDAPDHVKDEEDEEDLEEYKAKSLKKIEDAFKNLEEGTAKNL